VRVFIDIGHPAHVHYFRNFIRIMEHKGHRIFVTARDRPYVFELLEAYDIPYLDRGKGSDSALGKILYLVKTSVRIFFLARKFKPDLFLDFGTIYSCAASLLLRKRHIAFEDTEDADLYMLFYMPFVNEVFTSVCFEKDLGRKQKRFKGYMELCYLDDNYFTPDITVLEEAGLGKGDNYTVVRFVNWKAVHDIGYKGLSAEDKILIVRELEKYGKVFITSEMPLPDEIKKYRLKLRPERIHHLMYFAGLVLGESATMASESVILGTPAVYIDNLGRGYTRDLSEKYGNLYFFTPNHKNVTSILNKVREVMTNPEMKAEALKIRDRILNDSIDVTAFMVQEVLKYDS